MAGEVAHGFGENGELSRGAKLALDAYWAEHGGGDGGDITFTNLNNGYTNAVGGSLIDLNNGYSTLA